MNYGTIYWFGWASGISKQGNSNEGLVFMLLWSPAVKMAHHDPYLVGSTFLCRFFQYDLELVSVNNRSQWKWKCVTYKSESYKVLKLLPWSFGSLIWGKPSVKDPQAALWGGPCREQLKSSAICQMNERASLEVAPAVLMKPSNNRSTS